MHNWFRSEQSRGAGKSYAIRALLLSGVVALLSTASFGAVAICLYAAAPVWGDAVEKIWQSAKRRLPRLTNRLASEGVKKRWNSAGWTLGTLAAGVLVPFGAFGLGFVALGLVGTAFTRFGLAIHGGFADKPELGFSSRRNTPGEPGGGTGHGQQNETTGAEVRGPDQTELRGAQMPSLTLRPRSVPTQSVRGRTLT
jgi:hypothetical protein